MPEWLSRTEMLLGREAVERLRSARVAIFGVGGVGGYVVEALARTGIGCLDLIDDDRVSESNLNRQILATRPALGRSKVEVAKERVLQINPKARVNIYPLFYLPETAGRFDFRRYDYVADAIDTVSGKIMLALQARECAAPLISAMGAGNKLDPSAFRVSDIYETRNCPLARIMRRELKKRGVEKLKVVWSPEQPIAPEYPACAREASWESRIQAAGPEEAVSRGPQAEEENSAGRRQADEEEGGRQTGRKRAVPGSVAFVPAAAGLIMAGEIVKDLIGAG